MYYPFPQSIPGWQVVSAICILVAVSGVVLLTARSRPYGIVGWLWFLGMLVPTIGIVQAGLWPALADRWVYMPMIGILVVVVWGSREVLMPRIRNTRSAAILVAVIMIAYASMAHLQVRHWRDSVALFQRAVAVTHDNFVAHDNLGLALAMNGRFDEAFDQFQRALSIKPNFWKSHQNVGAIYLLKGENDLALSHFRYALKRNPTSTRLLNNIGRALMAQKRFSEAAASFRKTLSLQPSNTKARAYLEEIGAKIRNDR